jgi:hypothetical protein
MVKNLTNEAKENLNNFKNSVKSDLELTITEKSLISIAESLLILAEKIGKKLL